MTLWTMCGVAWINNEEAHLIQYSYRHETKYLLLKLLKMRYSCETVRSIYYSFLFNIFELQCNFVISLLFHPVKRLPPPSAVINNYCSLSRGGTLWRVPLSTFACLLILSMFKSCFADISKRYSLRDSWSSGFLWLL